MGDFSLGGAPLGKNTEYKETYDPGLLFPIPRAENRSLIGIDDKSLPFKGGDIWNGYELSWLNTKGKPVVAVLSVFVPCDSANIVESKSFKLYLNSFNQSTFDRSDSVQSCLTEDLSKAVGANVSVELSSVSPSLDNISFADQFKCLDDLDISITQYSRDPDLLSMSSDNSVDRSICSHLLKSNCPVTGQPDWASVFIRYKGKEICEESLLRYIVSYRKQQDFHEHCVESIFMDIAARCKPEALTVYARYTRRGGMDINPFRSNFEDTYKGLRVNRQ